MEQLWKSLFMSAMQVKIKRKRNEPITARLAIPVTWEQKSYVDRLKNENVDINEMFREFIDELQTRHQQGELSGMPSY